MAFVSSNAWRLPSKTVNESETSAVQKKKTSMLAADDIPDRCVVIVTLRLPTYNPTTFDQHSVARSQVSVRHPLQELEAAAPHWLAPPFYQHSTATLPVPNVSSMNRPVAPVHDVSGYKLYQIIMSSAKRKSSKLGPPSIKSMPACPTNLRRAYSGQKGAGKKKKNNFTMLSIMHPL